MKKINFVLPSYPSKPGGGTKIMYEYANRLALKGHEVTVLHSIKRPYKKSKTPVWLRQLMMSLRKKPTWFNFDPSVKIVLVREISDRYVPDADVTISTWWQMAYALSELSSSKGKKINLIQGYEIWTGQEHLVHESYKLPVQHVVISSYLREIVQQVSNSKPLLLPNAIDTRLFFIRKSMDERYPISVVMLYSEEKWKGSSLGIEALVKVKETLPDLKVTFFSVFKRPPELPDWIDFTYRPTNLPEVYNQHAVFFSPSQREGWSLPHAESMACGCAVVGTDIGGHLDFCINNETALLVKPEDVNQMADTLIRLLKDDDLKKRIARKGHEIISNQFSWESSLNSLEQIF